MSQPFDSSYRLPALRPLDEERGEFWVSNPFLFSNTNENLSAYERNGVHLNIGDGKFADISYLTGADSPGDGRSVVAEDLNGDGMPELLVRQVGGGPLIIYENNFPKSNWLKISLQGTKSNRNGIGSKLECRIGDKVIRRELSPEVNFHAQRRASVHFGLGKADAVTSLTILWPSGEEQILENLPINRHVVVSESGAMRVH